MNDQEIKILNDKASILPPITSRESDEGMQHLQSEILACIQNDTGSSGSSSESETATLHGFGEPQPLNIEKARNMLSIDDYGNFSRKNVCGNSLVTKLGNVFFKRDPQHHLQEQAIYQLSLCLGGGIVTPSKLLIIELPGKEGILEKHAVQASLAVDGVGLDDLLRIPKGISKLKKLFNKNKLYQELPNLLSEKYYNNWTKQNSTLLDLSWEEQCDHFLEYFDWKTRNEMPPEFTDGSLSPKDIKKRLLENRDLKGVLFHLIALMEAYPEFRGQALNEIFFFPTLFQVLSRLYPKDSPNQIIEQAQKLNHNFSAENLAKHLCLTLLTNPQDHKGDNFIVKIQHDAKGQLLPFEIVAIDNDAAMQGIIEHRKNGYHVKVKSIIYALVLLADKPVPNNFREQLKSIDTHKAILHFLARLQEYFETYHSLLLKGVLFPAMFEGSLHLHEHISKGFIERLNEKLNDIKVLVTKDISCAQLFSKIDLILFKYYQRLKQRNPDPEGILELIYTRNGDSLEAVMNDHWSEDNTQRMLKRNAITNPCYFSYWKTLLNYIQEKSLIELDNKYQYDALQILMRLSEFKNCQWRSVDLYIPISYFLKLYENDQNCNVFIKFFTNIQNVWLIHENEKYLIPDPQILFQLIPILRDENVRVVQALVSLGTNIDNVERHNGYTPLHFSAFHGVTDCIPDLIKAGATLEALDFVNQTPLDIAVNRNQIAVARQLIRSGAGRLLQLKNGLKFIEGFKNILNPDDLEICQKLLEINHELLWQLTLKKICQDKEPTFKVLINHHDATQYLRPEYYEVFASDTNGLEKKSDERPAVNSFKVEVLPNIFCSINFKEDLKYPCREIIVHHLSKKLFGSITPPVSIWKRIQSKKNYWTIGEYPVLASLQIPGESLSQVLERHNINIDSQSFCENAILAMLINPKNGKPEDYSVLNKRIYSLSNDHTFAASSLSSSCMSEDEDDIEMEDCVPIKTILFCMDQMTKTISQEVRLRLLSMDAFDFVEDLLKALKDEQELIIHPFYSGDIRMLKNKGVIVEYLSEPTKIMDVLVKLTRIQKLLHQNASFSLLDLLLHLMPEVGYHYVDLLKTHVTPKERFKLLTNNRQFSKNTSNQVKNDNKLSVDVFDQVIETAKENFVKSCLRENKGREPLAAALSCISKLKEKNEEFNTIQNEISKGDYKHFIEILETSAKNYFNQTLNIYARINFLSTLGDNSTVNLAWQKNQINVLRKLSYKELILENCKNLTDSDLENILSSNKYIESLSIQGGSKLSEHVLNIIQKYCPFLNRLTLINVDSLTIVNEHFENLQFLVVQHCKNLTQWVHKGEWLQSCVFHECLQFSELQVSNPVELNHLRFNCPFFKNAFLYEAFPVLIGSKLDQVPYDTLQFLTRELFYTFQMLKIDLTQISKEAKQALVYMVGVWKQKFDARLLKAMKYLTESPREKIEYLKENYYYDSRSPDDKTLENVKELLSLSQEPLFLKSIIDILLRTVKEYNVQQDQEYNLHYNQLIANVIESLGLIPHPEAVVKNTVEILLECAKDYKVNSSAIETLGKLKHSHITLLMTVELLISLLVEDSFPCKATVLATLSILPHNEKTKSLVVNTLVKFLNPSIDWSLKQIAIEIIIKYEPTEINVKNSAELILPHLKDSLFSRVSENAVKLLSILPITQDSLDPIIDKILLYLNSFYSHTIDKDLFVVFLGNLNHSQVSLKKTINSLLKYLTGFKYSKSFDPILKTISLLYDKFKNDEDTTIAIVNTLLPFLTYPQHACSVITTLIKIQYTPKVLNLIVSKLLKCLKDETMLFYSREIRIFFGSLPHTSDSLWKSINICFDCTRHDAAWLLAELPHNQESLKHCIDKLLPLLISNDSTAINALKDLRYDQDTLQFLLNKLLDLLKQEKDFIGIKNIIIFIAHLINKYKENLEKPNAVEILLPFLYHKDTEIVAVTSLVLSKIQHSEENLKIITEAFLCYFVKKDDKSRLTSDSQSRGFIYGLVGLFGNIVSQCRKGNNSKGIKLFKKYLPHLNTGENFEVGFSLLRLPDSLKYLPIVISKFIEILNSDKAIEKREGVELVESVFNKFKFDTEIFKLVKILLSIAQGNSAQNQECAIKTLGSIQYPETLNSIVNTLLPLFIKEKSLKEKILIAFSTLPLVKLDKQTSLTVLEALLINLEQFELSNAGNIICIKIICSLLTTEEALKITANYILKNLPEVPQQGSKSLFNMFDLFQALPNTIEVLNAFSLEAILKKQKIYIVPKGIFSKLVEYSKLSDNEFSKLFIDPKQANTVIDILLHKFTHHFDWDSDNFVLRIDNLETYRDNYESEADLALLNASILLRRIPYTPSTLEYTVKKILNLIERGQLKSSYIMLLRIIPHSFETWKMAIEGILSLKTKSGYYYDFDKVLMELSQVEYISQIFSKWHHNLYSSKCEDVNVHSVNLQSIHISSFNTGRNDLNQNDRTTILFQYDKENPKQLLAQANVNTEINSSNRQGRMSAQNR